MIAPRFVDPANSAASRLPSDLAVGDSAALVVEHMLGDGMSVIDPAARIWTAETAESLGSAIEDNPMEGARSIWDKLLEQLRGQPREVVLLAAEIIFLRDLPNLGFKPSTKIDDVKRVLSLLSGAVELPDGVAEALTAEAGSFLGGMGYNQWMWKQIPWFARFVGRWATLSEAEKADAVRDPWLFHKIVMDDAADVSNIRNALLFMVYPRVFEPISSDRQKRSIRDAFAGYLDGASGDSPEGVDRDLLAIRMAIFSQQHKPVEWFQEPLSSVWRGVDKPSEATPDRGTHYWIYSPGEGARFWDEFFTQGIMAIGWDSLGDLAQYSDREDLRAALEEESGDRGSFKMSTLALWQFQHEMAIGDIVFAKRGVSKVIGRGRVTSEPFFDPGRSEYRHIRKVEWTSASEVDHPGQAITKTLTDITRYTEYVRHLEALYGLDDPDVENTTPSQTLFADYSESDFLADVYMDAGRYATLRALLLRKKNVILQGPPGVGKTFAAQRLAYSIMGETDSNRVRMVQFHQSFSYEDFIMGWRPDGQGFRLAEGPFYEFCDLARDDLNQPYFFVIDEINRGNLSKIFGELLVLIEPDKRGDQYAVRLMYRDERFWVPENLYIIGMMNTADRGLALMDYALRRRFAFFEMDPAFRSSGFRRMQHSIASPRFDALVTAIEALNVEIAGDASLGPGFRLGHSYLCSTRAVDDDFLSSVVEFELVPLVQEYWFDDQTRVGLWSQRLRDAVAG